MKCSNKKCKGVSLDVARTYANEIKVERDRKCPRCGTYYKTVEMFVSDYETEINNLKQETRERDSKVVKLTSELSGIKDSLSCLFQFASVELKGSKKHE